jgi:phosphoenolpyruvate synthase/pyruvate phosphate dikinase
MLVDWGIDSVSVNPSSILQTIRVVAEAEQTSTQAAS